MGFQIYQLIYEHLHSQAGSCWSVRSIKIGKRKPSPHTCTCPASHRRGRETSRLRLSRQSRQPLRTLKAEALDEFSILRSGTSQLLPGPLLCRPPKAGGSAAIGSKAALTSVVAFLWWHTRRTGQPCVGKVSKSIKDAGTLLVFERCVHIIPTQPQTLLPTLTRGRLRRSRGACGVYMSRHPSTKFCTKLVWRTLLHCDRPSSSSQHCVGISNLILLREMTRCCLTVCLLDSTHELGVSSSAVDTHTVGNEEKQLTSPASVAQGDCTSDSLQSQRRR